MRTIFITLFAILQVQAFAHRENTYFLKGNFGDKKVGVRMDEFGEKCFARYFDLNDKSDKYLEGDILENNEFHLYTLAWNDDHTAKDTLGTLICKETTKHNWEGKLTKINGETVEVYLQPILMDSLDNPYTNEMQRYVKLNLSPYSAYRSVGITFLPEEVQKVGKSLKIQWYKETNTGIRHFRVLTDRKNTVDVDRINRYLAAEHIKLTELKYTCMEQDATHKFSSEVEIYFLNEDYVSYNLIYQSNCMNMGMEKHSELVNFLIAPAKEAMLEDIFWFGEGQPQKLREGSQEWYQYRYQQFGQTILQLMVENHPKEMNNTSDGCDYKNLKRWQFPKWHLTKKGLFLDGYSIMEDQKCRDTPWSLIPWKKLKTYLITP